MRMKSGREVGHHGELDHIPGHWGWPLLGDLPQWLRDARGLAWRNYRTYGPVYRFGFGTLRAVALIGPDANQLVFADRDKIFSSELGWSYALGKLFPGGLMLRDFEEHRLHRSIMRFAFRGDALDHYASVMTRQARARLEDWRRRERFAFHPEAKRLTLDVAAEALIGLPLGDNADRVNRAFIRILAASVSPVRRAIPGTRYARGLRARAELARFFADRIEERRKAPERDLFSQLCVAEEGKFRLSAPEIVDHMIFMLLAAYDTLASAMTSCVYALAHHPEWLERLRAAHAADDPAVSSRVIDEALRLYAPVPYIPRRALRAFRFAGVEIPENTQISLFPDLTHHLPEIWTDAERFDPDRFAPPREEHRKHPFAYVPFGGGAHRCLGQAFAKKLAATFLREFSDCAVELPSEYKLSVAMIPIPKPKDGLPVRLRMASGMASGS